MKLSKNFRKDSLCLEPKEMNRKLKELYLSQINKMHKSREEAYIDKKKRLEEALIQAIEW